MKPADPHFYTYLHRRADDGCVFYVGKGSGSRVRARSGRSVHWHRIVAKHGLRTEIVASFDLESDAFDHERLLIAHYRNLVSLCNHSAGGEGPCGYKFTETQRALLSEKRRGRKLSDEHRANLVASLKLRSPESYAKTAAALMGRPRSEETRAKIAAAKIGMKMSAEACAKISASNKGRVRSPEFKVKIVAALTGRPCSAETREKIAAAQRGRTVSQEKRERISKTLTGRRLSAAEKIRLRPLTHSAESRAKQSASMKGRAWSAVRRAAQQNRVQSF